MSATTIPTEPTPTIAVEMAQGEKTGRYIVLLKENVGTSEVLSGISNISGLQSDGGTASGVTHEWDAINGFAGNFDKETLATLQTLPGVASIVEDTIVHTCVTSPDEPWGLGRISSEKRLGNQDTELVYPYDYDPRAGQGVDIYIIDTGVRVTHEDFGGRASWSGVFGDYEEADGNGHGTHCAGTAIGQRFGVAKLANVLAIKVLSDAGSGSMSDVISGMNHALIKARASGRPSVVSMSLAGRPSSAMDNAARILMANGIHVVVAAGNEDQDASTGSPSRVAEVITVGASTILDERAWFSNYGNLVDIFAPGLNITSTWNDSDTSTKTISGTSMATPHVAGLIAYLISVHGNASPFTISHALKDIAFKGVLNPYTLPTGTPNLLISNKTTT